MLAAWAALPAYRWDKGVRATAELYAAINIERSAGFWQVLLEHPRATADDRRAYIRAMLAFQSAWKPPPRFSLPCWNSPRMILNFSGFRPSGTRSGGIRPLLPPSSVL